MKSRINEEYYCRLSDNDTENTEVPLQVNCCGVSYLPERFVGGYPYGRSDYYLIYMLGGKMEGIVNGTPFLLSRGETICISAKTSCFYKSAEPMIEPVYYLWIHFTGKEAGEAVACSGLETDTVYRTEQSEDTLAHFDKLNMDFRTLARTPSFDYVTGLELRYILFLLGKSAGRLGEGGRLDESVKYIHSHLAEELTVEGLATMEFLGTSRYREIFKSTMGVSPSEYIARLRISRAMELFDRTDQRISEVAERVGYRDRLYFQRIFKKYTGKTPGDYRKKKD